MKLEHAHQVWKEKNQGQIIHVLFVQYLDQQFFRFEKKSQASQQNTWLKTYNPKHPNKTYTTTHTSSSVN